MPGRLLGNVRSRSRKRGGARGTMARNSWLKGLQLARMNLVSFDDVRSILDSLPLQDASRAWSTTEWTEQVKRAFCALAAARSCQVCANRCGDAAYWPEWL